MARSAKEIAADLKLALTVMSKTNAQLAQFLTDGKSPPENAVPEIEVRLPDGRVVHMHALADELVSATI